MDSISTFPQINFSVVVHGRMQDLPRGPTYLGACDAWRSQAFARGVRGHASPKKKILMVQCGAFGAYFHQSFTFKKSKNIHFLYKNNDKL